MNTRRVGASDLVVSEIGIGCNNFGRVVTQRVVDSIVGCAIDRGVTVFDTADVYGSPHGESEKVLGRALKGRRSDVIIATKFGYDMEGLNGIDGAAPGSRRYILRAAEASLRRLNTDYIDLYQMHVPDPATPIEETLYALHDLVVSGKVRYIGSSKFPDWLIAEADRISQTGCLTRFISTQSEYSLLSRDAEKTVLPACERYGLGLIPYLPLAAGLLTGKYNRDTCPEAGTRLAERRYSPLFSLAPWDIISQLWKFARDRGVSLVDVAIGGLLSHPAIATVITGVTSGTQVRVNAAVTWTPSPSELLELDRLTKRCFQQSFHGQPVR